MLSNTASKTDRPPVLNVRSVGSSFRAETLSPVVLSLFGWCKAEVEQMAISGDQFRESLGQLTSRQLHLIGLAVACWRRSRNRMGLPEVGRLLATEPAREVIRCLYGTAPEGAVRCLSKLPKSILAPGGYLDLLELLDEPHARKVLCHSERINPNTIRLLQQLEPPLRRSQLLSLLKAPAAALGIDFLVMVVCRNRPDADRQQVLKSLADVSCPERLESWFCNWIEKRPFPEPPWPGNGLITPLRSAAQMHGAALAMKNCLSDRIAAVVTGSNYYYWRRGHPSAIIELSNDRLAGWVLHQIRGKSNKQFKDSVVQKIVEQFAAAGIFAIPKFDQSSINPNYWTSVDLQWLRP